MGIEYTPEEKELNRLALFDRRKYKAAIEELKRGRNCVETRGIHGMPSHIIWKEGLIPIIEYRKNRKGRNTNVPLRWRCHKYFTADEIAGLAEQLAK